MFKKIYECKSNDEFVTIERCDMTDGKLCLITDTIKPLIKPHFEICFSKSENSKFRQIGKCQRFDACTLTNPNTMNPMMRRLHSYWKKLGFFTNLAGCPLTGHFETCNINLDTNLLTFLPKGVLLYTMRYDSDGRFVLNMSMLLINT
ncbi:unnamed protein product [Chironomus riparius]|uniref:Uncharacterized protein n=1 Tax=Chironomus riparius TaxID=315576 RepID=A0A9N9S6M9_9DIPT|nr:unnamed protein product [Chironomus riparius]